MTVPAPILVLDGAPLRDVLFDAYADVEALGNDLGQALRVAAARSQQAGLVRAAGRQRPPWVRDRLAKRGAEPGEKSSFLGSIVQHRRTRLRPGAIEEAQQAVMEEV